MKLSTVVCIFLFWGSIACRANDINLDPLVVTSYESTFDLGYLPKENKWLGLVCNDIFCKITPLRLDVLEENVEFDSNSVPVETIKVREDIENNNYVTALFTNITLTPASNVKKVKVSEIPLQKIDSNENIIARWRIGDTKDNLSVFAKGHHEQRGYDYYLQRGENIQQIYVTDAEAEYAENLITFAGDLDQDGKIDLIINNYSSCKAGDFLYLSTHAIKKQLLGLVPFRYLAYWPCGC